MTQKPLSLINSTISYNNTFFFQCQRHFDYNTHANGKYTNYSIQLAVQLSQILYRKLSSSLIHDLFEVRLLYVIITT